VRVDSGVESGDPISPHYDPLIAKLIVHGPDREIARRRTLAALREYRIAGVQTVLPFLTDLLADPAFAGGRLHTGLVADFLARWGKNDGDRLEVAALALAVSQTGSRAPAAPDGQTGPSPGPDPWVELGGWTNGAGWP
jgi:3-methylcrotonyl-CoA carboxylase alpha subunit